MVQSMVCEKLGSCLQWQDFQRSGCESQPWVHQTKDMNWHVQKRCQRCLSFVKFLFYMNSDACVGNCAWSAVLSLYQSKRENSATTSAQILGIKYISRTLMVRFFWALHRLLRSLETWAPPWSSQRCLLPPERCHIFQKRRPSFCAMPLISAMPCLLLYLAHEPHNTSLLGISILEDQNASIPTKLDSLGWNSALDVASMAPNDF